MNPERYKKVKDIFLAACDQPAGEQDAYVAQAANGDADILREVQSLLREHKRDVQVLPSEPEGPLGSMSAILSRANIDLGPRDGDTADSEDGAAGAGGRGGRRKESSKQHDATHFLDDSSSSSSQESHSGIVDAGRFMAGTVVAGRYRIIELLGRGGMGEVYRADDIMLNQSIALKFLPALFGQDQKWLERFRNEVRLARQVTHPNVCRVFDIGEFQGEQFISMEYIDGENLASLLRRIGRVPHDKAMQIGRQLCAGLAAAHDRGVLHRDLKPANVMIDGRGSVRITDFGLAAPVDQMRAEAAQGGPNGAVRAGTPAYMSPEQLAGKPVTVRSDVYSLGLVLYEMFTGRRAFRAENLREYQKLHSSEDPTPPSEILDDIDPIVERTIMRCLEKDPKMRPASAMAVSAALPGGNPLREILAAGETPSPEVVAAAGETQGAMKPRNAVTLLVMAMLFLIGFVFMAPYAFVVQRAINTTSAQPAVQLVMAQNIVKTLGYTEPYRDYASGYDVNRGFYLHVEKEGSERGRLWQLWRPRLGLVYFWYRQSPELLVPLRAEGTVVERDPPPGFPGMIRVRLDTLGRLIGLEVEPTTMVRSGTGGNGWFDPITPPTAAEANWAKVFELAVLKETDFVRVRPTETPPVFADEQIAWDGRLTGAGEPKNEKVHIEAASLRGHPVYFEVSGDWTEDQLSEERAVVLTQGHANLIVQTIVIGTLLATGSFLAWKNYRSGRGDRQGAARMALAFFVLGVVVWLFRAHHVSDPVFEFLLFQRGMGPVLWLVSLMWVFYMALEPYVRRIWPETIISWSRMLAGKWFDPLVGRDVLAGAAVGVMTTVLSLVEYQVPQWITSTGLATVPVPLPSIVSVTLMLSGTQNYAGMFSSAMASLYLGLILLLFLVLVRMATKRRWAAALAFVLVFAIATTHYRVEGAWWKLGPENWLSLSIQAALALVLLLLLTRHGLVAVIFCLLVRSMLMDFPVTWDFSAWYAPASWIGIGVPVIVLAAGFYATMGGKPLVRIGSDQSPQR